MLMLGLCTLALVVSPCSLRKCTYASLAHWPQLWDLAVWLILIQVRRRHAATSRNPRPMPSRAYTADAAHAHTRLTRLVTWLLKWLTRLAGDVAVPHNLA